MQEIMNLALVRRRDFLGDFANRHDSHPIVFMDEIDAIGGRRFSEGSSADREIQRTLMVIENSFRFVFAHRSNSYFCRSY
jgi:ATP-dependent protease HslVU (ClpYQ) ATPase subunit